MKNNLLTLACLFVVSATLTNAQSSSQEPIRKMSFGLMGGYSLDLHGLDQVKLPGVPSCCTGYNSESGSGVVFAGMGDFRLSDGWDLIARLGYHTSSVILTAQEPITVRVGNEAKTATITHENNSSFGMVLIEPGVEWRAAGNFGLIGGLRVGVLTTATYSQKEILDPTIPYDYQIAETGVRNESNGDLLETSATQFGMFIGARYHLGLNSRKTIELVPEIQFAPLFTSLITTDTWSMSSVRFMIGLSYSIFKDTNADPLAPRE